MASLSLLIPMRATSYLSYPLHQRFMKPELQLLISDVFHSRHETASEIPLPRPSPVVLASLGARAAPIRRRRCPGRSSPASGCSLRPRVNTQHWRVQSFAFVLLHRQARLNASNNAKVSSARASDEAGIGNPHTTTASGYCLQSTQ